MNYKNTYVRKIIGGVLCFVAIWAVVSLLIVTGILPRSVQSLTVKICYYIILALITRPDCRLPWRPVSRSRRVLRGRRVFGLRVRGLHQSAAFAEIRSRADYRRTVRRARRIPDQQRDNQAARRLPRDSHARVRRVHSLVCQDNPRSRRHKGTNRAFRRSRAGSAASPPRISSSGWWYCAFTISPIRATVG